MIRYTSLLLIILLLSSCGTSYQTLKFATPSQEQATINILRGNYGKAAKIEIYQNGEFIGVSKGNDNALSWNVKPGSYLIEFKFEWSNWMQPKHVFRVDAKAGKDYFLKSYFVYKVFRAPMRIIALSEEDGKKAVKNLKLPLIKYAE